MGNAAFRHPREHVADLLPAFLNGTLDSEDRAVVQRHLAICADCLTSLAAWRAIAAATRSGTARLEASVLQATPATHVSDVHQPISHEELSPMIQPYFPATPAAQLPRFPGRRAFARAFAPVARIAAVIVIALTTVAGIRAYLNSDGPTGPHALAPTTQSSACTVQPLTDAQLAEAVYLPGTLDGTNRDQASYIDPAIMLDQPNVLPADGPVTAADASEIESLWATYQGCLASDPRGALSLLSQDGLRRIYFRYVYGNISANFEDRAANEPKVVFADATRQATQTTPEATKEVPATMAINAGQYQPSVPTGFVIRDLKTMADGRVIAGLDDPTCTSCRPGEYEGIAVFVKVDGIWMIDDTTVFHG